MRPGNAKASSLYLSQLFFVTVKFQIGFAALRIPYTTGKEAGHDGWLSVLVSGFLAQGLILLIWLLLRKFPRQDLFQIAIKLLGPIAGRGIIFLCILYFCLGIAYMLAEMTRLIHVWVLPLTPQWALLIFPVLCIGYLTVEPARVLARFMTLTFVLLFFPIVLAAFPMADGQILYLLPIGEAGVVSIMKGAKEAFFGLLGFESMFIMFSLSQGTERQKLGVISMANCFVVVYYTYLAIAGIVSFSPKERALVPEPILYMMKAISFKIVERPDLLFFTVWSGVILATISGYLFLASMAVHRLSGLKRKPIIIVCCIAGYIVTLFTTGQETMEFITRWLEYLSYAVVAGVPLLLLITAQFRKSSEGKSV